MYSFFKTFLFLHFSSGKFGACFIPGLCKQTDLTLFAARPGLRLWKSDVHGTVQATFILKDVFAGGINTFELYPRLETSSRGSYSSPEKHLGLVSCFFREGWVLTWNEYSIYLLDTVNQVGTCWCTFCFLPVFVHAVLWDFGLSNTLLWYKLIFKSKKEDSYFFFFLFKKASTKKWVLWFFSATKF